MLKKSYFDRQINLMEAGKDSIFEQCTIIDFNRETLMCTVYTNQSSQYRKEVPVLFPSFFVVSGIYSPPLENTTALLFWGSERSCFVIPAQFFPPIQKRNDEGIFLSASPGDVDPNYSLSFVQPGEHFIRSLEGSSVHVANERGITMLSPTLQEISLTKEGIIILADSMQTSINGYSFKAKESQMSGSEPEDFHMHIKISDKINTRLGGIDATGEFSEVSDEEFLNIISSDPNLLSNPETEPVLEIQAGTVFNDDESKKTSYNEQDLICELAVRKDGEKVTTLELGKDGHIFVKLISEYKSTEIKIEPGRMVFTFKQGEEQQEQVFGFN